MYFRDGTLGAGMTFFSELRRRNVIRMAGLYVVGAWLVVQVAETLLPIFHTPEWVLQALVVLLALGFIPALVLSWIFELTPDGLKRESDVDRSRSVVDHTARKLDVVVIVLLLCVGGLMLWRPDVTPAPHAEPAPNTAQPTVPGTDADAVRASVAVLPFLNMSPDPDNAFFADGIAEELLNVLARVDGLKVASRTSAFTFKGKDTPIPEIAKLLGVRHVLEGSVRKQGQQVRITAQLIEAGSDEHLWSQTYDRELVDIFRIQQEIAEAIAAELGGLLGTARLPVDAPTADLGAYERFLRGRARFHQRTELPEAIDDLEYAVRQDPDFADAWIYLAATQLVLPGYAPEVPAAEALTAAREAAERAQALRPESPLLMSIRGNLLGASGRQVESLALLQRAAELSHQDSTPVMWYGQVLLSAGYIDEAIAALERAVLMDPLVGINNGALAMAYLSAGREEEGAASARAATANGWPAASFVQVIDLGASGRRQEAGRLMRDTPSLRALFPAAEAFSDALLDPAAVDHFLAVRTDEFPAEELIALGMGERFFDWFEADPQRLDQLRLKPWMLRTAWLPSTLGLRESPRFLQLAAAIGLIELWEQRGYPPGCTRRESAKGPHLDCIGDSP